MGYSHRYYTDAERLRAVKGLMNANVPTTVYAKQIGVNPRTLRDWVRAFKSFNGGFINITTIFINWMVNMVLVHMPVK